MNKVDLHKAITSHMSSVYQKKNADYGDSFAKVRAVVPNAILVRLMDKMERIKTLMTSNKPPQVRDEQIEDTLLDLANYCFMELVERNMEKELKVAHAKV